MIEMLNGQVLNATQQMINHASEVVVTYIKTLPKQTPLLITTITSYH